MADQADAAPPPENPRPPADLDAYPPLPRRVFVNNFPYTSQEEELRELFSQVGEIRDLHVLYDVAGRVRGMALIQYGTKEAADLAINRFNGHIFKGRPLNVEYSTQKVDGTRPKKQPSPRPTRRDDRRPVPSPAYRDSYGPYAYESRYSQYAAQYDPYYDDRYRRHDYYQQSPSGRGRDDRRPYDDRRGYDDRRLYDDRRVYDDRRIYDDPRAYDDPRGYDDPRDYGYRY
jgi:RNA recognition motif-containing protein